MRKFSWIVMTNADPSHEKEFNAWYDDVHLGDLLRIPGVTAAKRSKLCPVQMTMVGEELQLADPETIGAKYNISRSTSWRQRIPPRCSRKSASARAPRTCRSRSI